MSQSLDGAVSRVYLGPGVLSGKLQAGTPHCPQRINRMPSDHPPSQPRPLGLLCLYRDWGAQHSLPRLWALLPQRCQPFPPHLQPLPFFSSYPSLQSGVSALSPVASPQQQICHNISPLKHFWTSIHISSPDPTIPSSGEPLAPTYTNALQSALATMAPGNCPPQAHLWLPQGQLHRFFSLSAFPHLLVAPHPGVRSFLLETLSPPGSPRSSQAAPQSP